WGGASGCRSGCSTRRRRPPPPGRRTWGRCPPAGVARAAASRSSRRSRPPRRRLRRRRGTGWLSSCEREGAVLVGLVDEGDLLRPGGSVAGQLTARLLQALADIPLV